MHISDLTFKNSFLFFKIKSDNYVSVLFLTPPVQTDKPFMLPVLCLASLLEVEATFYEKAI